MMEIVISVPNNRKLGDQLTAERMQVTVHVQAEVLTPTLASRRANIWLTMNAGHLLMVKNPELMLGDMIQWRFDVYRSVPQLDQIGSAIQNRIGQLRLDAMTGEVIEPVTLIEELKANASSLAAH
jgi:hypothetical protein